ncbi:ABC transporter substrate-binding protein [Clostridium gasigenes]|uniref:Spermidine/putrescine ABC transporter substrate-binding protein n=1 Tax=Clostridium gasigenes TaxID=94869 RepID=A0A1H0VCB8_9CLOT|nr:spermidine/putrescine ABC transporter substrate-binding protein [Clostridium gasigenes]MBB6715871.1 spermidine/putrescine ABC transporter substrate-binding protein [Clostridium gasigenes]SDP76003.1 spermidine/putrescine transport system substrate-binding protein [Clostridium gasigenes]
MNKIFKITALLSIMVLGTSLFVGCGKKYETTINILNYGENIADGVIEEFEEKYDVKVNEKKFDEMETMYIEATSGKVEYDAILVSDNMADRLIQEGKLQKLNKENIPNLQEMNEDDLAKPYDPNNEYTVPYMNGTIGIVYNKDLVKDPVDSWDIMWDKKYEKQIFLLNSQRDTIGMALKRLGYSINSTSPKELEEAKQSLIDQKPLVLKYGADDVMDIMKQGEAAIAMIWSGEGLTLADENENLEYIVPKEGADFWLDSWAIPTNANNKDVAEKFIDFVSEKENALKIAEEIGYTTPHKGAMEAQSDEVKNNPGAYMPKEVMDKCEVYKHLNTEELELYNKVWTAIGTD